ncbi:MAG TPA: hypothetical protein VF606_06435 [Geminicoccaceae bacterium]|jgi:hypothetical protein
MPTRTRIAAALVAALVVGLATMAHDRWSAAQPTASPNAASEMQPIRWVLFGLAAGLALLAATGVRRPPPSSRRRP